jgi:multisubunit Na+/H+ antiporter MnhF subunit
MSDIFKGFMALRLLGFAALAVVLLVVVGIKALARGADVLGVALLVGALLLAVAGLALARFTRRRSRQRAG